MYASKVYHTCGVSFLSRAAYEAINGRMALAESSMVAVRCLSSRFSSSSRSEHVRLVFRVSVPPVLVYRYGVFIFSMERCLPAVGLY